MPIVTSPSRSTLALRVPRAVRLLAVLLLAACRAGEEQGQAVAADSATGAGGAADVTRIAFVDAGAPAAAANGALLAGEEAKRTASLVGRVVVVERLRAATPAEAERVAREAIAHGAAAIVGGYDDATCRRLSAAAKAGNALWFNVGCRATALRDTARHPHAFHVEGSEAMYRGGTGPATLWHGALTRYGAAQLNERYRRRFGEPMDAAAWAAWMAVKVVADATLRLRSDAADSLAAHLIDLRTSFDGHKGEGLRFGGADHQLQQPVYPLDSAAAAPRPAEGESLAPGPGVADADPRAPLLVVTNEGSASVTVIDAGLLVPLGNVPVRSRPRGIQPSPDGQVVYVALSDAEATAEGEGDAVIALDPRTGREIARHAAGSDPEQFAVSPDGRRLYSANEDAGLATVTDLATGQAIASLPVGIEPEGVAVSPDGRWVYVTAETSNTVSVIDTRRNEVVASFMVDVRPRAAAFAPDGRTAWVTNEISGTVTVVDVATHTPVATVSLGDGAKPVGVVVAPDGRTVYVACGGTHAVAVVDAARRAMVATIPVGRRPWGLVVAPDGRRLFTANGGSGDVSVVDLAARRVTGTIPVGERPWGLAWVAAPR